MNKNPTPIIRLEEISKAFPGVQALDKVSFTIPTGEIHAVVGENGAGKSTLMNILAGEVQPDSGKILFLGKECQIPNPYISQKMGISVVYQELSLCPNLSIAENISLSTAATPPGLALSKKKQFKEVAEKALARLGGSYLKVEEPVRNLSIAKQQLVEIAKAISGKVKVLILDEPNSALAQEESQNLFSVIRQLKEMGVTVIYVSHRLEEVLEISDRITILRDGKFIDTLDAPNANVDGLITRMVGRAVNDLYQRKVENKASEEIVLECRNLTSDEHIKDLTYHVNSGEVVGIAGLPGSGKEELVECLFGLRSYQGEIWVRGKALAITSPGVAIKHGLAFIPADRRGAGALLTMNVQENIVAAKLPELSRAGFINRQDFRTTSQEYVRSLDIRISSLTQQMATLSGGNQQKVILARGLATKPAVLILHEPTRGIDVGAKAEIYHILQQLTVEGVGILIVSSELSELIGQCDRILALHEGQIMGEFSRQEADEETILACTMGQEIHL
jgi:ribose transport system ATP-binding protein